MRARAPWQSLTRLHRVCQTIPCLHRRAPACTQHQQRRAKKPRLWGPCEISTEVSRGRRGHRPARTPTRAAVPGNPKKAASRPDVSPSLSRDRSRRCRPGGGPSQQRGKGERGSSFGVVRQHHVHFPPQVQEFISLVCRGYLRDHFNR